MLIQKGANVGLVNLQGKSCVTFALESDVEELATLILSNFDGDDDEEDDNEENAEESEEKGGRADDDIKNQVEQ